MSGDSSPQLKAEIGHVLFVDIVGYSKLLIDRQSELLESLKRIVRETAAVRSAKDRRDLIRLPTGDGIALVFRRKSEAPVECALEISAALKTHPELPLRMGIHSGPINEIVDVNERANVAGAGIDGAQRVMDCGDAGHILLSKRVADDLAPYPRWNAHLHDLGETEVKHGARLRLVNLYTEELGNSAVPSKLEGKTPAAALVPSRTGSRWLLSAALLLLLSLGGAGWWFATRTPKPVSAPGGQAAPALAIPEKSIAVLPFENLSEEKANAYFADGVQDEILTDLARVADLKVISRTSVIGYRETANRNLRKIGQELGVAHLLEGSVQRSGNRIRVNAQLIDARSDAHLWGQTYDRDLADVFAIQSEIAKTIADQLQARLSPNEKMAIERAPTKEVAAFDLYSRARTLMITATFGVTGQQDLFQAADLLNQAIRRDPEFFQAYCQLAVVHDQLYFLGMDHSASRLSLAEEAIQVVARLRPDAGETQLARAENLYRGYLDYEGALAELEAARRTLPNDPRIFELTGYILRRRGQHEEGLRSLEKAIELDPRNYFTMQQAALSYNFLHRYAEAVAILDRALAIVPKNIDVRVGRASEDFYWKADTRPLHETIDDILAETPDAITSSADGWLICGLAERDPVATEKALAALGENQLADSAVSLSHSVGEGLLARMLKDEARAHAAFTKARAEQEKRVQMQPDYGPPLCVLGLIDAGLGNKELALEEGRRAVALLPVEKDALNGGILRAWLAIIATWTGEKDLALEQLAFATTHSNALPTQYGGLKLLPFWDPLRGDPRFEQIVADLAPKDSQ